MLRPIPPANLTPRAERRTKLTDEEIRWRDYYDWLKSRGYELRRRYRPGWKASWLDSRISWRDCDDGVEHSPSIILDAERLSDGSYVVFKRVKTSTTELPLTCFLSSPQMRSQTFNHCVPLLDVLPLPDTDEEALLVLPLLRSYERPHFETVGEVLVCIRSLLEGLVFLHENNIAHLDIAIQNAMMDAGTELFPKGFHPVEQHMYFVEGRKSPLLDVVSLFRSRTLAPVRYYWIDFGTTVKYPSFEGREKREGAVGHNPHLPEFCIPEPWDPFPVDMRNFADMIWQGLDFLEPFSSVVGHDDPRKRPVARDALQLLVAIINKQSSKTLWKFLKPSVGRVTFASYWGWRVHRFQAMLLHRSPMYTWEMEVKDSLKFFQPIRKRWRAFALSPRWIDIGKSLQTRYDDPPGWRNWDKK